MSNRKEEIRNNVGLSNECSDEVQSRTGSIDEAMDIYSKETSIEFGNWINTEGYRVHDRLFNTWENDGDIEVEFTTEKLFQLFLKSKQ